MAFTGMGDADDEKDIAEQVKKIQASGYDDPLTPKQRADKIRKSRKKLYDLCAEGLM